MSATVTIVDVGQGSAAVVRTNGCVVIIDAGRRNSILEYCLKEEITEINLVLISHADEDHLLGLTGLLASETVQIREVRLNGDAQKASSAYDHLMWELEQQAALKPSISTADDDYVCDEVHIEVLAPSPYLVAKGVGSRTRARKRITSNTISALLRIKGPEGRRSVLLTGDLDEAGLQELERQKVDLRGDVLVFPHHGGGSGPNVLSFAERLCRATRPRVVVFSNGRGNYDHPRPDVVQAVRETLSEVRVICTQLSRLCAVVPPTLDASHLLDTYAHGRTKRHCCGGTVRIAMTDERIDPLPDPHAAFIDEHAPTALCRKAVIH